MSNPAAKRNPRLHQRRWCLDEHQSHLHGGAQQQHVHDGAKPWLLTQWYPDQQDNDAGDHNHPPDAKAPSDVDSLGKDRPRVHSQARAQHHGGSETKEKEACEELPPTTCVVEGAGHPPTLNLHHLVA